MLVAVGIPVFMVTLDNLVVTTALPVIRADLGATVTDLQWFVNAYTLPFAAFLLTASRAGQGIGGAAVAPLSLTLLAQAVPDRLRSAAVGIWGGISGLGVAVGPVVGGAVVEGLDWSWIFWLNVPVGVLAVVLAATVLPE
ncbi:MFS transporter [Actinoplanes nipponensis]|uniref:MFS transporter n=1 Tax=Actinoplanes nipponensis TaxID=135950 RepID=UPI0031EABCB1